MPVRQVDRRHFLRLASAGSAAGLAAASQAQAAVNPDVLIIGAGMSGVSTSYYLRKLGISSLILEGRDRIGGRLWSSKRWPDAILDLGGAWVHDSLSSPLTPLVKQFNIQTVVTPYVNFVFRTPDGINLSAAQVAQVVGSYGAAFAQTGVAAAALRARGFPDRPLGTELDKALAQLKLPPLTQAGVNTLIDVSIRGTGTEPSDASLYYFATDANIVGVQDLAFPKGYVQLVEKLAAGQQILYSQVVKRVQYTAQGVTVVTNQGTFSARCAVITLPVGVLKAGNVEFAPALPAWKQGAINRLHTGVIDKLCLRFPRAFWDTSKTFLFRTKPPGDRFDWWLNGQLITGQPILINFVTADVAAQVEGLSDAEVVSRLMAVLRAWYPTQQIPNPVDFQRSRWLNDPFARGAYPHIPPGGSPADWDLMATPVPYAAGLPASANRLFFAGDGTHPQHPFSVWGAYETGKREAARIQQLLK